MMDSLRTRPVAKTILTFIALGSLLLLYPMLDEMQNLRRVVKFLAGPVALQVSVFLLFGLLYAISAARLPKHSWLLLPIIGLVSIALFPAVCFYIVDADPEAVGFYIALIMPINAVLALVGWLISRRYWKAS